MITLEEFAKELASPSIPQNESWRPRIVKLSPGEREALEELCRQHHLRLVDEIQRQLHDFAGLRRPGEPADARQRQIDEIVDGDTNAYGNWIHLPWEAKIVHLLDAASYFEVITNRNHDKITREEQATLRTKRVGVTGLSVGGEAAVTVAQEHLCGHLRLADFDRLDLSNLNRLNAGCDDLGLNKALVVARRIAKVDPYLEVEVFHEGVTESNLEAFLDGLDLLIEECDSLPIKYEIRRLARDRGINLVFAADERGFLSIEPYRDHPELPLFHGRIRAPQPPRDLYPSQLAFMRALTEWLGGWASISEASRSSLQQIGTNLCGYPQLASEAEDSERYETYKRLAPGAFLDPEACRALRAPCGGRARSPATRRDLRC